ncbi:hypothetical protein EYM_05185 [Ignicoccus islandicus DSM 13165]|uniref:Csa3 N-terminal domain-containing protein n=1 Tax=Ignicoccus islandicus DSM 13165 TaxID=940295 RepID=A0A0U3EDP5_9CREN|nr:hypothetical protein [Ignicoccus islandicus]ALU12563.1 hypothetical protein EYM_05185 [Ignicoccus islandicus DSM 13165]
MRVHVVLGFDITFPVSCVSQLDNVGEVVIYVPDTPNPRSEEALKSFEEYLKEKNISFEIVRLNPCDYNGIFEVILKLSENDVICFGSGMRSLSLMLILACFVSSIPCYVKVLNEALGKCMDIKFPIQPLKREEAIALALALTKGSVSPQDLEEYGLGRKTSWKVLNKLVDQGLLIKVKKGQYKASSVPWRPRT